jgi:hypothetical protein
MSAQHEEIPQAETLPAIVETKTSTVALVVEARALQIATCEDRIVSERYSEALQSASKKWDDLTLPNKKATYNAYQIALRLHDDLIAELDGARKALKQKQMAFDAEQERIRRAEEARLQAIAQKHAEDEALAMAAQAEAAGDHEIAEAIVAAPVVAPVVRVAPTAPAPSRLTAGRTIWGAVCFDLMALVKAVAAGTQPITLVEPNMTALNQMARAAKSAMRIPGVLAEERKV